MVRQRAAPPKLIALNQAFLSTATDQPSPLPEREPERWGRWIENACIALAWNAGQQIWYWREEPWEVDMILSGSWGHWAVEVKTGSFGSNELAGLS